MKINALCLSCRAVMGSMTQLKETSRILATAAIDRARRSKRRCPRREGRRHENEKEVEA